MPEEVGNILNHLDDVTSQNLEIWRFIQEYGIED